MSDHVNDLMFEKLSQVYSELGLTTLGDLLAVFGSDNGLEWGEGSWGEDYWGFVGIGQENRASLQYQWYVDQMGEVPPERDTLADAAFRYWSTLDVGGG